MFFGFLTRIQWFHPGKVQSDVIVSSSTTSMRLRLISHQWCSSTGSTWGAPGSADGSGPGDWASEDGRRRWVVIARRRSRSLQSCNRNEGEALVISQITETGQCFWLEGSKKITCTKPSSDFDFWWIFLVFYMNWFKIKLEGCLSKKIQSAIYNFELQFKLKTHQSDTAIMFMRHSQAEPIYYYTFCATIRSFVSFCHLLSYHKWLISWFFWSCITTWFSCDY